MKPRRARPTFRGPTWRGRCTEAPRCCEAGPGGPAEAVQGDRRGQTCPFGLGLTAADLCHELGPPARHVHNGQTKWGVAVRHQPRLVLLQSSARPLATMSPFCPSVMRGLDAHAVALGCPGALSTAADCGWLVPWPAARHRPGQSGVWHRAQAGQLLRCWREVAGAPTATGHTRGLPWLPRCLAWGGSGAWPPREI